ncbi:MAG TPA: S41 family peptidase [Dehalococcoidia bacterium]|nr:S41 family peptidase [Dehalococcoidia bacterium]
MKNKSRNLIFKYLITFLFILIISCSTVENEIPEPAIDTSEVRLNEPPKNLSEELRIIWDTYQYLLQDHVDQKDLELDSLAEGAVIGIFEKLDDQHSGYISPERFAVQQSSFQGKFEGIGATVQQTKDGKRVVIIAPIDGSPAEDAGIKGGDIILAVDGEDTEGWTVMEAVNKIRGKGGTAVILTIQRIGESNPIDIKIIRGEIKLPSVRSTQLQDAPYAHIRVSSFTRETHNELVKVLKDLDKKNKGIILDLRQNPGGLVTSVVDIAGEFLDEGSMVMYEIKGNGQRKNWLVKSKGNFKKLPMVVLVNEYSASGSEVLSGALQDYDRAIVIGTTTFGKGSVGIQRGLSNGGGIYYTVARWYTPLGRMIENVGLKPDVVQKQPGNETDDLQLKAAITQLNYQLDGES